MHCKFPIFINGTIAVHVSGSISAHHQERLPKTCRAIVPLIKNRKFTVHLLVSFISNLRDAWSYNPKVYELHLT